MLAIRAIAIAIATLIAIPATAAVVPYTAVGIGAPTTPGLSSNNVYDIDLTMCTNPDWAGCRDRNFALCSASATTKECEVRPVPKGRCAAGNSASCNWTTPGNTAAHRCTGAGNTNIQCVTNADCPSGSTCSTATGATPAQVAACACAAGTADPVCGSDAQARCSDGDESIAFGDPHGVGLCTHTILSPTSQPTNCGFEGGQAGTGPRSGGFENAPSTITPQRQPGTGVSTVGPIYEASVTYALTFTDPDPNFGVRRFESIGKSQWTDAAFADGTISGSGVSAILVATPFEAPQGWDTGSGLGTCTGTSPPGALCQNNGNCTGNGTCGALGPAYALAKNEIGFIFTANVDPNTAPATCPPVCGLDYDFHTFEQRALEAVGASDREAGIQLSLDNLAGNATSGIAGAGDIVSATRSITNVWLTNDIRCRIGGDPNRASPGDSKVGICSGPASPGVACDPLTEDGSTNDCGGLDACRWCNTPADGTAPFAPDGYDNQAGNCETGFDCSRLDIDGPNDSRMGVQTGVGYDLKVPLAILWTSGLARAEVRDPSCPAISGQTSCSLGAVTSGSITVGIGAGGTFSNGQALPAFSVQFGGAGDTCCDTGASISWGPKNDGSVSSPAPQGTGNWFPGANGIPGCIGDSIGNSSAGANFPACAGPSGQAPGTANPGSDDVAQYNVDLDGLGGTPTTNASDPPRVGDPGTGPAQAIPNPLAGASTAAGAKGSLTDPNGSPTIRSTGAGSVIDLNVLGTGNNDSLFKIHRVWCPVRTKGGDALPDCWYDTDGDGIDDDFDSCPSAINTGTDTDGDGIDNACDNCLTIANANQANFDGDNRGDLCDNCTFLANSSITPTATQTITGGQLDDDGDGFGNQCDADYNNAGSAVDSTDLGLFKFAFGKKRVQSTCNPGATSPCDRYDHNNAVATIDSTDFTAFKTLFGKTKKSDGDIMDKCTACPLACSGDACP
jgi:hypothetical protein